MSIKRLNLVVFLLATAIFPPDSIECREVDALIVQPLADTFKSLLNTVTTGSPLQTNVDGSDMLNNLMALMWKTWFPFTIPSGFTEKFGLFFQQLQDRIDAAPYKNIPRRGIEGIRNDTNAIIDAMVNEIRRSPDGLYTDLTQTKVNGVPLQDAMVSLGQQTKAFGGDLMFYLDIGRRILDMSVLPNVASTLVDVTGSIRNSLPTNTLSNTLGRLPFIGAS